MRKKLEKMQKLENMAVKTCCHGNVKAGEHVVQVSKYSQKIF